MIRRALSLALTLIACTSLPVTPAPPSQDAYLTLRFNGLKDRQGHLLVAVSSSPRNHSDETHPTLAVTVDLERSTGPVRLGPLPYGVYSVKAFQDLDRNARLDKDFWGRPLEPYGFSNKARGLFGPPSWDASRFPLQDPELTLTIELK